MIVASPRNGVIWSMVLGLFVAACSAGSGNGSDGSNEVVQMILPRAGAGGPVAFPAIDDHVQADSLLIQVTFDLGDGSFIMVASDTGETLEGLRLHRYRFNAGGAMELMAVSSPAYDSWTMLPTFFPMDPSRRSDPMWILANFGEKESWGQKVLWLDRIFFDKGFMHVALPERMVSDETTLLKRRNIAPFMRVLDQGDTTYFRFACDSVYLYDEQNGEAGMVISAPRIHYTHHRTNGLLLWIDGEPRPALDPS